MNTHGSNRKPSGNESLPQAPEFLERGALQNAPAITRSSAGAPTTGSSGLWVLVVEDEPATRLSIRVALLKDGFRAIEAESGEEALRLFDQDPSPDIVILDIGLPGLDGFKVCQKIREKRVDTAILMLTARAEPEDKIAGLTLGADDYVVKPFNPGELVARIRAVVRRSGQLAASMEPLVFEELLLDVQALKAFKAGVDVNLSPREFALLAALVRHPGQVMSREQLGMEVWGTTQRGNARALDVFVCKLREKIEDNPARPHYVKTAWGAGYICG
jgi:two-component system, OmpR family, alkaline phosphatase synthesis response regulator PhoP